MTTAYL